MAGQKMGGESVEHLFLSVFKMGVVSSCMVLMMKEGP